MPNPVIILRSARATSNPGTLLFKVKNSIHSSIVLTTNSRVIKPAPVIALVPALMIKVLVLIVLYRTMIFPAEQNSAEIYQSRRMQIEFLSQNFPPPDSLIFYLISEADLFAGQENYTIATSLLDQAIEFYSQSLEPEDTETILDHSSNVNFDWALSPGVEVHSVWQIVAEAGTDYSRNEYELNYLETDSVILEELNNPYAAFRISRITDSAGRSFNLSNYNRLDRNLFQNSFFLSWESLDYQNNWRLEGYTNLFWLFNDSLGNFWENEFRAYWNNLLTASRRLFLQSRLRYKFFFPASENYRNLFSGEILGSIRQQFGILRWLELSLRPSVYQENQSGGLRYLQFHSQIQFQQRIDYNKYGLFNLNYYFRDWQSSESYKNQYQAFRPTADIEWPFLAFLGIQLSGEWENRKYTRPDLSYSDFQFATLDAQLKYYYDNLRSFGLGYVYEYETHTANSAATELQIEQENYSSEGVLITLDILSARGLMISLSYQYLRRNYPYGGADDLLGIYSNRNIQNIAGFGYIPLDSHWQFQFYINYDHDRDRDHENNDNFSTLFNFSLLYKF